MKPDRSWMMRRKDCNGQVTEEFKNGVDDFIKVAKRHSGVADALGHIFCPCSKCKNRVRENSFWVGKHLYEHGFMEDYLNWTVHGENQWGDSSSTSFVNNEKMENRNPYVDMVIDAMDDDLSDDSEDQNLDEDPNPPASKFYTLLRDAEEPLWDGCHKHTKLSAISQLLNLKSEFNMSESCYDRMIVIIKSMLPETEKLPENFYRSKKMVNELGLGYEKIDACPNHCMLYDRENKDPKVCSACLVCGHPRFKPKVGCSLKEKDVPFSVLRYFPIIPRLQRLYMSKSTAQYMRWHADGVRHDKSLITHPADAEAWKHFDATYPMFTQEVRNVRLGLSTDGFSPFGVSAAKYTCWPVFVTPYNLPPSMCMRREYIFLSLMIPGPTSPGKRQNHGLPGADECYAYNDSEDEGMHLIWEKQNQQETDTNDSRKGTDTKNATKGTAGSLGVSNSEKMNNATLGSFPRSTDPPTNNSTSVPSTEGSHDRRKVISVEAVSNPRRFVPQTVTRDIISRVITRMPTPAEKWKDYPSEMKDELFKEFTGKYKFTSDYDCNMSRTVWERTCMDRYPDHLKNARKMALREVNSVNLVDTKGHAPKGMKAEVWDGLVDIWLKPEWKKKSDANRCNRAALPDAVLHTGGSINFGEHKIRMEKELNHEVSYRDVYDRVHKKKDGEYVSQRSKKFIETYDTAMLEKYGDDFSTHPAVDSNLWADTFSHHKTRQTFVGRSLDLGGFVSASSAEFTGPSNILATSEEAIKKVVDKAMSSFVQSQLMPLLEPIISLIQSMHKAPMQGEFAEGHMDARSLGKK